MSKSKFIVIDGTDGSGKATQTALLVGRLKKEGVKVKTIDFPRYYKNFFGKLIGECLAGDYGDFIALDPHIASVLYAADRFESAKQIIKWLDKGYTVIADRYISSNQIHQGAKIKDAKKRNEFLRWLDKMEYGVFKAPKPALIIFLSVPVEISRALLRSKDAKNKKAYLKGKDDLAEKNRSHLEDSRASAISLVKKSNNWKQIECAKNDAIMSKEAIHELVYDQVKKLTK